MTVSIFVFKVMIIHFTVRLVKLVKRSILVIPLALNLRDIVIHILLEPGLLRGRVSETIYLSVHLVGHLLLQVVFVHVVSAHSVHSLSIFHSFLLFYLPFDLICYS